MTITPWIKLWNNLKYASNLVVLSWATLALYSVRVSQQTTQASQRQTNRLFVMLSLLSGSLKLKNPKNHTWLRHDLTNDLEKMEKMFEKVKKSQESFTIFNSVWDATWIWIRIILIQKNCSKILLVASVNVTYLNQI